MRCMLKWLPEDRKTAMQLHEHEWLHTFLEPEPVTQTEPEVESDVQGEHKSEEVVKKENEDDDGEKSRHE